MNALCSIIYRRCVCVRVWCVCGCVCVWVGGGCPRIDTRRGQPRDPTRPSRARCPCSGCDPVACQGPRGRHHFTLPALYTSTHGAIKPCTHNSQHIRNTQWEISEWSLYGSKSAWLSHQMYDFILKGFTGSKGSIKFN